MPSASASSSSAPAPDPVYLDHAATTPVRPEVVEAMTPCFGPRFGNPSSAHRWGREARAMLEDARTRLARCIGADPQEVYFVSCGSEADNLAVLGGWRAAREQAGAKRNAIVTTPVEHKAILAAAHQAEHEGAELRLLEMERDGQVVAASYDAMVRDDVAVCSVMWVNNETGNLHPIPDFAAKARARGVLFHTDAVQAFGKVAIDAKTQPFDLLSLSGHKLGAPKGIGAMYIRRGSSLRPLMHGGGQERGFRPGTENVAFAVGLARAAELATAEREAEVARVGKLRDQLEATLRAKIPGILVHGANAPRAPHVLNVSVPGLDSSMAIALLDRQGIAVSGGSACQTDNPEPSHVLMAMHVPFELAGNALRMSLGSMSSEEGIARAGDALVAIAAKARAAVAA